MSFNGDDELMNPNIIFEGKCQLALRTHIKELQVEILYKKLCQFILLEIEN